MSNRTRDIPVVAPAPHPGPVECECCGGCCCGG